MNRLTKISRTGVLALVAIMLLIIPNMSVYSAVGGYHTDSMALVATQDYNVAITGNDKVALPAVAAVAAGVALSIVAAVGFIDGWNSIHAEATIASLDFEKNYYNRYDFSKFDN